MRILMYSACLVTCEMFFFLIFHGNLFEIDCIYIYSSNQGNVGSNPIRGNMFFFQIYFTYICIYRMGFFAYS